MVYKVKIKIKFKPMFDTPSGERNHYNVRGIIASGNVSL